MKYKSNLDAGELICAGIKSAGIGSDVELTDAQAEQAMRKGYVSPAKPTKPASDEAEEQVSAKKK